MFCVELNCYQLNTFGGVPERLIGAVLKTVVRASVPWVRIPPPPPFRKSLKRLFFSMVLEGDKVGKQIFFGVCFIGKRIFVVFNNFT